MTDVASENLEAQEAWNGVLFDRFVKYRDLVIGGLATFGDEALRAHPPKPGDRALDVGCGFGDTAQQLSQLVGPSGSVLGVDIAPRFIEQALEFIRDDEAVEVTPQSIRLRKVELSASKRATLASRAKRERES